QEVVQDHAVPVRFQPDLERPGQFDPALAESPGARPGPGRPLDALVLAVAGYREIQAGPPPPPIRAVGDHRRDCPDRRVYPGLVNEVDLLLHYGRMTGAGHGDRDCPV